MVTLEDDERVTKYDDVKIIQIIPSEMVKSWRKKNKLILSRNEVCLRVKGTTITARETAEFEPEKGEDLIIVNTFEHIFTVYMKNLSKDRRTFYSHIEGYVNMINNDQILNATKILISNGDYHDVKNLVEYKRDKITTFNLGQLINYIIHDLESKIQNSFYQFSAEDLDKTPHLIDGEIKYRLESDISDWSKHCSLRVKISNVVIDNSELAMQKAREAQLKHSLEDTKNLEDIHNTYEKKKQKLDVKDGTSTIMDPVLPEYVKRKNITEYVCNLRDVELFDKIMSITTSEQKIIELTELYNTGCT